jgi:fructose-1,6-bisphosphatase
VKVEALAALNSYKKSNESDKQKEAELVKKLAAVVKPAVDKIHADVKQQALKTQVTHEHNKLVQDSARWDANEAAHKLIMQKFDQLEAALTNSNAATKKVFKIYGINV